ncbi:copper resistance CopC family protein [Thermomonospora cellulosilytica]|uniref:Methionine-rich copper-binding protein CopC n=1 Tax=Thermomonospora cellulosilytica TaxID=1411118 RepID=A0A7W3N042_9ACTN|nr:copper resistance CopC family protein [Thermomonospora cellulosilytica]MBA9005060.1 methionine-rich copper-binding protein CopC [Thermomonospora cellulosilytica]
MTRARRLLPTFLAALLIGLALAPAAQAHTALKESSPADGQTVAPPTEIVLTFTDEVNQTIAPQVVVTGPGGAEHQGGKATTEGAVVTQPLAGALPPGDYTVGWRVVAEDGHPVTGSFEFTVEGRATPSAPATQAAPPQGTAPTTTADPAGSQTGEGGGSSWWWIGLAALVVAALAGGAAMLRKRSANG